MSGPLGSSQWMYSSGAAGYQINDSLRFEDGSSAYLTRTPASAGNLKTWTFSCWFKRGNLGLTYPTIFSTNDIDPGQYTSIIFLNETLYLNASGTGANYTLITNQVFRDVSGWYHLVWSVDTTQATSTDRMKLYINGEQVTSFSTATYPSLNKDLDVNATTLHAIGYFADYGRYWDGYLSDIYLIDGQALDPTDFGETIDGYWRAIPYAGTYGTNGFHLDFNGNTNDASGNGNDWTANNISAHDYVPDSPTNNFATYNINVNTGQSLTYEEGNLNNSASGSFWSSSVWQQSSLGVTGGANAEKYYFEYCTTTSGSGQATGVAVQSSLAIDTVSHNDGVIYYNTSVKTGSTVTVSGITNNPTYDVLRFAFDASNGKVWIGNSTGWFNSGDPAAGTNESGTIANYDGSVLVAVTNRTTITSDHIFNFGQDSSFAGFKASGSANGSDANGIGDFYYAVPSGYLALCTANLTTPTIVDGSEHFVPYLYTADNTSPKSRTGMGFSPDFLWFKDRTTAFSHGLYDTVRGIPYQLQANNTSAESSYTLLDSFDADGFTTTLDGTAGNVLNYNTDNYVTWAWKAGGTAVSNTSGSTASNVSANTDAGFSIVTWFANAATGTVGHGLNSAPELVIAKPRDDSGTNWYVMHTGALTASQAMNLDTTGAAYTPGVAHFNSTYPTSSVISYGGFLGNALTNNNKVAYCFHSVEGYSKVGKWVGNGSASGPMVYTGFRPSFIFAKKSSAAGDNWTIYDTSRDPYNVTREYLIPNSSQTAASTDTFDILSNGFKIRTSGAWVNTSGATYIYLAIGSTPFKFSPAR